MPAPIPSNVRSFLPYQWHQVAIFTEDPAAAIAEYERLGYRNWIYDKADLVGYLDGNRVTTEAHMAFNYDIFPGELEFLRYVGPNRHHDEGRTGVEPFISHMSTYVDNVFLEATQIYKTFGLLPYHQFITANNTNPNVHGKKRFIECIYDFRETLGYDLKLIQKTPWEVGDEDKWLMFEPDKDHTHDYLIRLSEGFQIPAYEFRSENTSGISIESRGRAIKDQPQA